MPGQHVGLHELKRVAEMRGPVDVWNRRADENTFVAHRNLLGTGAPTAATKSRPRFRDLFADVVLAARTGPASEASSPSAAMPSQIQDTTSTSINVAGGASQRRRGAAGVAPQLGDPPRRPGQP